MNTLSTLRQTFARFWADESGATAIEYAMIAAGVGAAIVTAVYSLGTQLNVVYNKIGNAI